MSYGRFHIWVISYGICLSLTYFPYIISRSIYLLQMALFRSFYGWGLFRYIYVQHLLFPCLCQWTLRLLPCPGCCTQCCNEICSVCVLWIMFFSRYMPRSQIAGSYASFIFSFKGTSKLFSIVAVPIYIPSNNLEGSFFSIQSPAFIVCWFFDDSHSGYCEMISHCSFDLHFSNN